MGKIKMGGNATIEFEADYYEFHITVSLIGKTSGDAISKGHSRTEEILSRLQNKLGIDIKTVTLKDEKISARYDRKDCYRFKKEFYFQYKASNSTTENIVSLLEKISDVEYNIKFKLANKSEKEQQVLSEAVNNAKEKAEKLATALGSHITGFEEIKYEFNNKSDYDYDDDCDEDCDCLSINSYYSATKSLSADLKNPKIEISKSVDIIWTTD
ncbi:MAG: SIMPL domain-containing protein [Ruminococcus sp.]|nr:SIMPL domain-containing protein [Ruminococcus sp.]